MARLYFDTEFIEDGHTIDLISIGIVRDDGEWLYLENEQADLSRASDWVQENVIPHLSMQYAVPRSTIAAVVRDFAGPNPEWWAYYADYDWVALCQLYGRMVDLPAGWPKYCRDLRQWLNDHGHSHVSQPDDHPHEALADARWVAETHQRYATELVQPSPVEPPMWQELGFGSDAEFGAHVLTDLAEMSGALDWDGSDG